MNISIQGIAYNAKGGAMVLSEERTYYLEGLAFWTDEILNKKVEVKGFLKKEFHSEKDLKDEEGNWQQGMVGEKLIIRKPVWKLID